MNIQDPLDRYRQLIEDLPRKSQIDSQQALDILTARDDLQVALEREKPVPIDVLDRVIELDDRFRENATKITAAINENNAGKLARWRENVNPSAEAWWWRLESIESPTQKYPLDLFLKLVRFGAWVANMNLLLNIASRFGVTGVNPVAVIIPVITALVSGDNKIPTFGSILKQLNIPNYNRETTKFFTTAAFWLLLVFVSNGISELSKLNNINGVQKIDDGDFSGAEKDFKRSISLDKANVYAYYNLGRLYEELLEIENAKKQYQIAIGYGYPRAYNNLGRLYIKEQKYSEAASLLVRGVNNAEDSESKLTKYSLYKNLGWARLKQERYIEAQEALVKAIDILRDPEKTEPIPNPGAAHCLLAQTLEQLKQPKAATSAWEQCRVLPPQRDKLDPDEDTWHYIATQKLGNKKTPKETNAKLPKVK